MQNASFFVQARVYFKKIARISMREKAWIYLIFAIIISTIVVLVTSDNMFKNYESTRYGFFTLASACIWIGIFNSIQSVCKEHNIIRSEYRQGTKLSSYIFAHILWQMVLCFAQSIIIFLMCVVSGFFGEDSEAIFISPYLEHFITIFLLTFGSAVLGLMISSFSGTPTTAMKIMPFVLIIQLVLSGVLFELEDFADTLSYITFSKWGVSAFGCVGDIQSLDSSVVEKLPDMPGFDASTLKPTEDIFNHNAETLLLAWSVILLLIVIFAIISVVSLKIKNRDS